ncbi:MAG: D-glycerate dehydrogenase [Deltaproteobacteria bacterium]|nr:D-glycerate dehydrogenase [Deltaproteobacteria bacterium]
MQVLVTARMPDEVLALLRREHQVESYAEDPPIDRQSLLRLVTDKEGLLCTITDLIDADLLDHAPVLKVIANFGVGFEHIDLAAATQRGLPVTNTPGVLTDATADLTFTLILATARRVVEGDKRVREGKFTYWAPLLFLGQEVSGKTLGIIGLGRIGQAVAQRARGFGMRVLYYNRTRLAPAEEKALNVSLAPLETLLREADFVTLHVPLTPQTRHLIGRRELALMKPTAHLINTSRGPVVDEAALVEALRLRRIGGAGLDVYAREPQLSPGLADQDHVVLLPHVGSATIETRTKMGLMAAANLLAALRGERPPNCLNWTALQEKDAG